MYCPLSKLLRVTVFLLAIFPFGKGEENHGRELSSCEDDPTFSFPFMETMTSCADIESSDEFKKLVLCNQEPVRAACQDACGLCTCINDSTFFFEDVYGIKRKCDWISRKNENSRRTMYCGKSANDGSGLLIQDKCMDSCNLCPTPVESCMNSDTFLIKDIGGKERSCSNIRNRETRRARLCLNNSVKENCPHTCGVCCVDDLTFEFPLDYSDEVGSCWWLDKNKVNAEKRKAAYCDRFLNGSVVRSRCPNACNYCFDEITEAPTAAPTVTQMPTLSENNMYKLYVTVSGVCELTKEESTSFVDAIQQTFPDSSSAQVNILSVTPSNACQNRSAGKLFADKSIQVVTEIITKSSKLPHQEEIVSSITSVVQEASSVFLFAEKFTPQPTAAPTASPTFAPTPAPTSQPTPNPTPYPTREPSSSPSSVPTSEPSMLPSTSALPSQLPSTSTAPSVTPSESIQPSETPTLSVVPSMAPSLTPSDQPSSLPSSIPSDVPSDQPSDIPSSIPSDIPSSMPSLSSKPSVNPSNYPSLYPSSIPSDVPSDGTETPSAKPTISAKPSSKPSPSPSAAPTTLRALFESIVETYYGSSTGSRFGSAKSWFVEHENHPSSALNDYNEEYFLDRFSLAYLLKTCFPNSADGILTSTDHCGWNYVTCDANDKIVQVHFTSVNPNYNHRAEAIPPLRMPNLEKLTLRGNSIPGSIPDFNLPKLKELDLSKNDLSGSIPNFSYVGLLEILNVTSNGLQQNLPDFDKLPNLNKIATDSNSLSGSVPSFASCSSLTDMTLSKNQFTGTLPDFNLPELLNLDISDNNLDAIPDFQHLAKLESLELGKNSLTQFPNFNSLPALLTLAVEQNSLVGTVPDLFKCQLLEKVTLKNNELTAFPNFNLPNLQDLDISENKLKFMQDLDQITAMQKLNFTNNELTSTIPHFVNMPELLSFEARNNTIIGTIPDFILPKLNDLDLGRNNLSGSIPNFSGMAAIQSLLLDFNQLDNALPALDQIPNIEYLDLKHNKFSSTIPALNNMPELILLDISHNQLTGSIPNIETSTKLVDFYLHDNQLSGSIPNFTNKAYLKYLELYKNQLSGSIPEFDMPLLENLMLGENQLTGQLPSFSKLTGLLHLHLSNNQLTGQITDVFLNSSPKLKFLFLDRNSFTGVTGAFASNSKLEILSAEKNSMTGTMPVFKQTTLHQLYLSGNSLTGTIAIPPSIQIVSLDSNAFSVLPKALPSSLDVASIRDNNGEIQIFDEACDDIDFRLLLGGTTTYTCVRNIN